MPALQEGSNRGQAEMGEGRLDVCWRRHQLLRKNSQLMPHSSRRRWMIVLTNEERRIDVDPSIHCGCEAAPASLPVRACLRLKKGGGTRGEGVVEQIAWPIFPLHLQTPPKLSIHLPVQHSVLDFFFLQVGLLSRSSCYITTLLYVNHQVPLPRYV